MNLFKRLFKGGNSKKTNDAIVKSIRESKEFSEGKRCFRYANFGFFCIYSEKDIPEYHLQDIIYFARMKSNIIDLKLDINSFLYYSKDSDEVFYMPYTKYHRIKIDNKFYVRDENFKIAVRNSDGNEVFVSPVKRLFPIKIANSLSELFGNININEILTEVDNEDYWLWEEEGYESPSIAENLPKCVIPNIDLRIYFKEKYPHFLSNEFDFDRNSFVAFLTRKEKHLIDLIPSDFYAFNWYDEKLVKLMAEINLKSEKSHFNIISFEASCFWGIIDMNDISKEDAEELVRLGLVEL